MGRPDYRLQGDESHDDGGWHCVERCSGPGLRSGRQVPLDRCPDLADFVQSTTIRNHLRVTLYLIRSIAITERAPGLLIVTTWLAGTCGLVGHRTGGPCR